LSNSVGIGGNSAGFLAIPSELRKINKQLNK
jgi:hypothetical protein